MRHKGQVYAVTQENAESSYAETRSVAVPQNSSTIAFQIADDRLQQQKVESNRGELQKVATEIEVIFHRKESPEPVKSFYPDGLEHKPLKPVNPDEIENHKPLKIANLDDGLKKLNLDLGPKRRSIRANGRSISREIPTEKKLSETCRRHGSLPNVESFREIENGKRHSVNLASTNDRHLKILTSSFFSSLLSDNENDTNDEDEKDVLESTENVLMSTENVRISKENVQLSTEIVYKFCGLAEDVSDSKVVDNGLLPEPALYRMESSNFSGKKSENGKKTFSESQPCDLAIDDNSIEDFDVEQIEAKEIFI